jgi:glycosyltransferase involved in cell wall biosynthesis
MGSVRNTVDQATPPRMQSSARVAFLFPSLARAYYWQPVFKDFVLRFPHTAVFTCIWPGFAPGCENSFTVHTLPGLRYVDLKKRLPDVRYGFIWTPLFSILRKLADFGPDVIFTSGFSAWTVCALLFRLVRHSRVIIFWEGCSTHAVKSSRIRTVLRRCMGHFADGAVSNADEGTAYLHDVIGIPHKKLCCYPCQVPDVTLLSSGVHKSTPILKQPVFLYVGGLTWRKGWRHLLDACSLLVKDGLQDFSVLFVGGGEQENEMRDTVAEYGLTRVVHQVGAMPYPNLGAYYNGADVFVSPTRQDTWGVAILEAMAFGKPVLCSKYAGARQMVAHGENGFIFDPLDTRQLADYMAKFIVDEKLAQRMGARSLEKMAPFTPACAADMLSSLALAPS